MPAPCLSYVCVCLVVGVRSLRLDRKRLERKRGAGEAGLELWACQIRSINPQSHKHTTDDVSRLEAVFRELGLNKEAK